MVHFLLLISVLLGVVFYFMTADERTRILRVMLSALHYLRDAIALEGLQCDAFFEALRARNRVAIATPLLVVLSTIVFVRSPLLDLIVNAVCVWQIGLILERVVGRLAFTTVYIASGIAAAIVSLSVSSDGVSIGPTGSTLGMYGLLLATSIWNVIHRSSLAIPLDVAKRLAQVAAVFVLYKLATAGLWNAAALAALACGIAGGIVMARDIERGTLQIGRLATAMATVVAVVTLYAVMVVHRPPSQTVDVRPEIDRVISVESRTAGLYDKEVDRFRRGRTTATALIAVIEKTIVPELHAVAGRLRALKDVPQEQKTLIATAERFLKLREESWRLRAVALQKSDMRGLQQADTKERASHDAFHRLSNMARVQNSAGTLGGEPPL